MQIGANRNMKVQQVHKRYNAMKAISLLKPLFLIAMLAGLAACGRAGPLEPPPSSVVTDADGNEVEAPKEDKPFILDGLLN